MGWARGPPKYTKGTGLRCPTAFIALHLRERLTFLANGTCQVRSPLLVKSQTSRGSNCFNLFAYGSGHVALGAFMGNIWRTFITIWCNGAGTGREE